MIAATAAPAFANLGLMVRARKSIASSVRHRNWLEGLSLPWILLSEIDLAARDHVLAVRLMDTTLLPARRPSR